MAKKKAKSAFPDVMFGARSELCEENFFTEDTLLDAAKYAIKEKNGMVRIGIYKLDKVIRGKCGFTEY